MRVQRFVFNGYGLPVPTVDLRPVPMPSPFRDHEDFGDFGGAWEDWCDINYYTAENNAKCKECNRVNIPFLGDRCTWPDPKTIAGRAARGLPQQTDLERLGPAGSDEVVTIPETGPSAPGGSWFDQNKTLVLAGGAAAIALLAFSMRGGRRMNGLAGLFGFGSRKVRRRKARRN